MRFRGSPPSRLPWLLVLLVVVLILAAAYFVFLAPR
jgi:hypothetical protein